MANQGRQKKHSVPVPVIDLFAGPGGLGEGFSSLPGVHGRRAFTIRLSIEKDPVAHETLKIRAFFRQFPRGEAPDEYYKFLRREISQAELFNSHPTAANAAMAETWNWELGKENAGAVRERITAALAGADNWVLIGGPPCQAYSLAGRSRNMGIEDYDLATDPRQKLYVDYLQVIADHAPAVFVMENVKGLLSAKVHDSRIFGKILADLRSPHEALLAEGRHPCGERRPSYALHSLNPEPVTGTPKPESPSPRDFLVMAEKYGIPQARHRLIIVGVRDDLRVSPKPLPIIGQSIPAERVLNGLPPLRSGISGEPDGNEQWVAVLREGSNRRWLKSAANTGLGGGEVERLLIRTMRSAAAPELGRGGEFIRGEIGVGYEPGWFIDPRIGGVCNHSTRAHMKSDLHRYLFAACFANINKRPPSLSDFPKDLLPDHQNVDRAIDTGHFSDRFRVQLPDRPSTTITSHISKDGHYYIHYDPAQCRSLTVREAARLQTFPDNYFFCGGRTAQYTQVGNAVPPLLAHKIALAVYDML